MFSDPVVFVLGAGASAEYGLPTGVRLRNDIAKALRFQFNFSRLESGSHQLLDHLRQRFGNQTNPYTKAGNELAGTMGTFPSVDEALHYFSNREEILYLGKIAIVHEILRAEQSSKLYGSEWNPIDPGENGWIFHFLSMALSVLQKEQTGNAFDAVTLINFNYDRVVEHFLYNAFQSQCGLTRTQSQEIVSKMNIIRPYGSIGPLEWQEKGGTGYGDTSQPDFGRLSASIRTYTEEAHGDGSTQKIASALNRAKLTLFLGFGYHRQNMNLLQADTPSDTSRYTFATVKGVHEENHGWLKRSIAASVRTAPNEVRMLNMSAAEMLRELRLSIMSIA
jgi:hypothetical protein